MKNFDPNAPRKHKWPREEFDLDPGIVTSSEFWKIERQQNGGKADSDDDTDEEDDWDYEYYGPKVAKNRVFEFLLGTSSIMFF